MPSPGGFRRVPGGGAIRGLPTPSSDLIVFRTKRFDRGEAKGSQPAAVCIFFYTEPRGQFATTGGSSDRPTKQEEHNCPAYTEP